MPPCLAKPADESKRAESEKLKKLEVRSQKEKGRAGIFPASP
jgi:hypothetical protein